MTTDVSGPDVSLSFGVVQTTASPGNASSGRAQGSYQTGGNGGSIWVSLTKNQTPGDGNPYLVGGIDITDNGKSANSGGAVRVANLNFGDFDGSTPLTINLSLVGKDGFEVSFDKAVNVTSGSLSQTYAGIVGGGGPDLSDNFAEGSSVYFAHGTGQYNTGRGNASLDLIEVSSEAVPEPGMLGLVLGMSVVGLRRRR